MQIIKDYINEDTGELTSVTLNWDQDARTLELIWEEEDCTTGVIMQDLDCVKDYLEDFTDGIMWGEGYRQA
jgi:hypothetical protein